MSPIPEIKRFEKFSLQEIENGKDPQISYGSSRAIEMLINITDWLAKAKKQEFEPQRDLKFDLPLLHLKRTINSTGGIEVKRCWDAVQSSPLTEGIFEEIKENWVGWQNFLGLWKMRGLNHDKKEFALIPQNGEEIRIYTGETKYCRGLDSGGRFAAEHFWTLFSLMMLPDDLRKHVHNHGLLVVSGTLEDNIPLPEFRCLALPQESLGLTLGEESSLVIVSRPYFLPDYRESSSRSPQEKWEEIMELAKKSSPVGVVLGSYYGASRSFF